MEKYVCILIFFYFATCQGLYFTLNREERQGLRTLRNTCGVLLCEKETNISSSSTSGNDQDGSTVLFNSITSMSVFRKRSIVSGKANDQYGVLLGSLTSQAPVFTRVANGRKVDGLLESGRATLRVELVKRDDCQAEFTCQVQGVDNQGREAVITTNLVQQESQSGHPVADASLLPAISLQVLNSLQQLTLSINGLEQRLQDKITSIENRLEDKVLLLKNSIDQSQKDFTARSDTFEHRLTTKLDLFENKVESKIDNNNNLNKLMQLDFKVSQELAKFRTEAKQEIMDSLVTLRQRVYDEQSETLINVSKSFEKTLNGTASMLTSVEEDFAFFRNFGETNLLNVRNETAAMKEMLTSGEIVSRCITPNNTAAEPSQLYPQPLICEKNMGKDTNRSYPHYITMSQLTLQRKILCDTQTDGGGWTVIQRRINGDVYFNRDWKSFKEGFGKVEPNEDFWLGNEAVHVLTYVQPYELRVELTSDGKDYVASYKTFALDSEANKYRIRLGAVTSSIDSGGHGLSYSNNAAFSTYDQDNDVSSSSCAVSRRCAWWYKNCNWSKLTTKWINGQAYQAWYTGSKWLSATRIEMKIRPIKSD
ncbi:ficolin-2 [Elysia marginata]|uniref:Ficolin-2 n=1 Tax=Elysia marginata TaxID=1093978 RepID=A0AAV4G0P5_9GAST|nr:ficolin-2 [Elysia marginata]